MRAKYYLVRLLHNLETCEYIISVWVTTGITCACKRNEGRSAMQRGPNFDVDGFILCNRGFWEQLITLTLKNMSNWST